MGHGAPTCDMSRILSLEWDVMNLLALDLSVLPVSSTKLGRMRRDERHEYRLVLRHQSPVVVPDTAPSDWKSLQRPEYVCLATLSSPIGV